MNHIDVDLQGHIAVVTLNRPPVNALIQDTYRQIGETFGGVGGFPGVRVVVLRSEGKIFCPGNDVAEFVGVKTEQEAAFIEKRAPQYK